MRPASVAFLDGSYSSLELLFPRKLPEAVNFKVALANSFLVYALTTGKDRPLSGTLTLRLS